MIAPLTSPLLAALPGIRHGFFTRRGGSSTGVYGSLNCGLGSHDERSRVIENRDKVGRHLGTDGARVLTCYQIHSAEAVIVERPWEAGGQPRADALVTRRPGLAVGTLAADCTPILFADHAAGVVAAAHAGWKGALGGILEGTLAAMESIGASRGRIVACVGPCISQQNYEVGPEFEARFVSADAGNARFFLRPDARSRPHFDLPGYVLHRLGTAGLVGRVETVTTCTYADEERFYSYRRTTHRRESDYGRQISAIIVSE